MFTGIVEEIGTVKSLSKNGDGIIIEILCSTVLEDTKIGDSIAINGCCQTVTKLTNNSFYADASAETLSVTNFKTLKEGNPINLERALTLNSRLGGHIVSGHVDCIGELVSKERVGDFYNLEFNLPIELKKYVIHKGSITVNGISLTIANIKDNRFRITIIPQTYQNTNLHDLNIGDCVNIETDIIGKYVKKMLSSENSNNNTSNIDIDFLQKNGFV